MKRNFTFKLILTFFALSILLLNSCNSSNGSSYDSDLIALKGETLIEGQSIEAYFNEIAGIGGKVTWEQLNPTEQNVKKYKVTVVRSKSIHPNDVEVTFIYDSQTRNYEVEEALFQGGKQTLTSLNDCFNGLRMVMSTNYKLNE